MIEVAALVDKFKLDLDNTILTYLRKLDAFSTTKDVRLMTAPEEDVVLLSREMRTCVPCIRDENDNPVHISAFLIIKGELHVKTENGTDYMEYELSFDDLIRIATTLENEWERKTKEAGK